MSGMKNHRGGIKSRFDTAGQRQVNLKAYQQKQCKMKQNGGKKDEKM